MWLSRQKSAHAHGHHHHHGGDRSLVEQVLLWLAIASYLWLGGGVLVHILT